MNRAEVASPSMSLSSELSDSPLLSVTQACIHGTQNPLNSFQLTHIKSPAMGLITFFLLFLQLNRSFLSFLFFLLLFGFLAVLLLLLALFLTF